MRIINCAMICYICGKKHTQKCHVKDHCEFDDCGSSHKFFNIIELCANCHGTLFDSDKVAIVPNENIFLILRSLDPLKIDCIPSKQKIHVKDEYVTWKNEQSHNCLQRRLRAIDRFVRSLQD